MACRSVRTAAWGLTYTPSRGEINGRRNQFAPMCVLRCHATGDGAGCPGRMERAGEDKAVLPCRPWRVEGFRGVGPLGRGAFGAWGLWGVGPLGRGAFGAWGLWGVGPLGRGAFGAWGLWGVGPLGRGAFGAWGLWGVGPLGRGADPSRSAHRARLEGSAPHSRTQRRNEKRRHLHAAVSRNQMPSPPRWTAAIPVRETSTSPSGLMIVMNCSILEVRPVISKVK